VKDSWNNILWVVRLSFYSLFRTRYIFLGIVVASVLVGYFNACALTIEEAGEIRLITTLYLMLTMFAITFAYYFATEIRNEIASKRIQPILSSPITREEYFLGKWLGLWIPSLSVLTLTYLSLIFVLWEWQTSDYARDMVVNFLRLLPGFIVYLSAFFTSLYLLSLFVPVILNLLFHISIYLILLPSLIGVGFDKGAEWVEMLKYLPGGYFLLNAYAGEFGNLVRWRVVLMEMRNDFFWVILFLLLGLQVFRRLHLTTAQ